MCCLRSVRLVLRRWCFIDGRWILGGAAHTFSDRLHILLGRGVIYNLRLRSPNFHPGRQGGGALKIGAVAEAQFGTDA